MLVDIKKAFVRVSREVILLALRGKEAVEKIKTTIAIYMNNKTSEVVECMRLESF